MDWLSVHHAKIVCFNKFIRIPFIDGQLLHVSGEKPSLSSLNLIACFQAQTYLHKKYVALVALVVEKKERKIEDIPVIQEYPEVFPDDVLGLPPMREVEFRNDLEPGATPIARASYRLAPSEIFIDDGQSICRINDIKGEIRGRGWRRERWDNWFELLG
ncbi:uncharacterized protein LOC143636138 [Bidens hawaiensis]|uniref:uncharacterized protein LOC143636138 n=1 Tax=Bidens hawaiensis TaxID=980011 RepID=UPI004049BB07